jgi:hypothetical protein
MIDKADLRVPRLTPFTPEFQEVYSASRNGDKSPWRSSRYFASVADLRSLGYDARLHMFSSLTAEPIHKLEIYDTGQKSYADMCALVRRIFLCDPERLGLMRVDLCADIHGVEVGWFKRHMTVKGKRLHQELGQTDPYRTIQQGTVQTLYAGRKPNQFRVYNKSAERLHFWKHYAQQLKRDCPDAIPVPYAEMFGHPEDAIITRVERQLAARDLEKTGLCTFASLRNGAAINPFLPVQIHAANASPAEENYPFTTWCAGMYLQGMVVSDGLSATFAEMRKRLGRNFYRERKRFADFLCIPDRATSIDGKGFFESYRNTITRQLTA